MGQKVDGRDEQVDQGDEGVEEGQQHRVHVVLTTQLAGGGEHVEEQHILEHGELIGGRGQRVVISHQ